MAKVLPAPVDVKATNILPFLVLVMFLSVPLILGSWWSLLVFVGYVPIIVVRTLDEERLLRKELDGYEEYCQKVRWRILPFVW